MDGARELIHGTAIAVGGAAALIRGPSGSGKSDLALRCLATPMSELLAEPPILVADDQVVLTRRGHELVAEAPATIRGKIEARGLGIQNMLFCDSAKLVLIADLVEANGYERLPDPHEHITLLGLRIRRIALAPFEGSAPVKLLLALQQARHA